MGNTEFDAILEEALPSLPVLPVQVGACCQALLDDPLLRESRVCHEPPHKASCTLHTT